MRRRVEHDFLGCGWHRYSLVGPRGAVNLTFAPPDRRTPRWMGIDFGYHSPRQVHDWQEPIADCDLLGEVDCFYDGSGLRADDHVHLAESGDTEAIYAVLEAEYEELFGSVPR